MTRIERPVCLVFLAERLPFMKQFVVTGKTTRVRPGKDDQNSFFPDLSFAVGASHREFIVGKLEDSVGTEVVHRNIFQGSSYHRACAVPHEE